VNGLPRSLLAGILVGIGIAGFVDETVFHQILHWHHFYNLSTPNWGLISDGLFHAFSWFSIIGGFFIFADLRGGRRGGGRGTCRGFWAPRYFAWVGPTSSLPAVRWIIAM